MKTKFITLLIIAFTFLNIGKTLAQAPDRHTTTYYKPLNSPPTNPKLKQIYLNGQDNNYYTWNGSEWICFDCFNSIQQYLYYDLIPLKNGIFMVLIEDGASYTLDLPTNIYNLEDNSRLSLFSAIRNTSSHLLVSREYKANTSDYPESEPLEMVLVDKFYDSQGYFIGTAYPESGQNNIVLNAETYRANLKPNTKLQLSQSLGSNDSNYLSYIDLDFDEINYSNGLIKLPFDYPTYIEIFKSDIYYGNTKLSNYDIGLVSDPTENKLGVIDRSGLVETSSKNSKIKMFLEYKLDLSVGDDRIYSLPNNSYENVVNYEINITHSAAMSTTFEEAYGDWQGQIFNASSPNISDFRSSIKRNKAIDDNDVDLIFSAGAIRNELQYFNNNNSFNIIPLGSNDLVEQNVTSAIDVFPTNYILVTSRSETDNDGSDPLGTSYGFGVEFNEPTLTANLTGQGLTDWPGSAEHQQSPATAIVAAKLKYIKDQTGAPWSLVRQAARETASNANNYNVYRGFGVIDTAAAISLMPSLITTYSQDLANYYEATTTMPLELQFEDKSDNTLVNKRDLNENFINNNSDIDAETLDGLDSSVFVRKDASNTIENPSPLFLKGSNSKLEFLGNGYNGIVFSKFDNSERRATYELSPYNGVTENYALTFNQAGGRIQDWNTNFVKIYKPFSVDGDITAYNFIGNGSQINSVNATTLDNLDSAQFIRSDANDEATGKLNIGAGITPYYNLNVKDAIGIQSLSGQSELIFRNTTGAAFNNVSTTPYYFKTANTLRFTIEADGKTKFTDNMSIGTTTNLDRLNIGGRLRVIDNDIYLGSTSANSTTDIGVRFTEFNNTSFSGFYTAYNGSSNQYIIYSHSQNDSNVANDLKRFSIYRDNGNVTIGDLPISGNKLNVDGNVNADSYTSNNDVSETALTLNATNTNGGNIYYYVTNNRLIIRGSFTGDVDALAVITNIPLAYRPDYDRYSNLYTSSTSATEKVKIATNGDITADIKAGITYYLDLEITLNLGGI